ncbi:MULTISPECIES: dynamin family protein [unclassified Campylobacter]|uniref:dynamin family protein n=1 Tax=unclassified Campylobacter TaxID=2593542 RepID=UPI0022E9EF2B|nr:MULTISPECIES: dynamin family protein [unclassified Campylobacter]MDA3054155.1 dynamin family protein [Campylobacter sp. VBCF_07 NA4]MDA3060846.1 dynamin family protein [Campylobacter sp. VBCF_02 NA5]MDA3070359.1 dynamin family protein [Campylobacter sp. VBCF_08 NA3]WBR53670.1 dynamin family protein [Campylobacter sp. VBCF_01 NA2]
MKVTLNDEFEKFMDIYAFLHDISNDHGIDDDENIKANLKIYENKSKELVAKEVVNSNSVEKVWVCVIGDFSSGKSSFINSILGESVCPVALGATTSSITRFVYADTVSIVLNDKEISQDEYEKTVRHAKDMEQTKTYQIEYGYPFRLLQNIALLDTPGFSNSQNSNDETVTLNEAKKSDIALLVVDINQGDINSALLNKCKEIQKENPNLKWHIILNKADTKAPSEREKIKQSILQKYDFVDDCFVYSALDSEKFLDSKNQIISILNTLSKQKDEILKEKFKNEKIEFYREFENVIFETKNHLEKATKFEFNIKIEDFKFIRSKYENAIRQTLSNNLKEVLLQSSEKKTSGIGEIAGSGGGAFAGAMAGATAGSFIPGVGNLLGAMIGGVLGSIAGSSGANEIEKEFTNEYYHDLYFVIKNYDDFVSTMQENTAETLANEILLLFCDLYKEFENESSEEEFLSEWKEIAINIANEAIKRFTSYCYQELLNENSPQWQVVCRYEEWAKNKETLKELVKARTDRRGTLCNLLYNEGFDDFCGYINDTLNDANYHGNLNNDFSKDLYRKTIDKINEFMKDYKFKAITR